MDKRLATLESTSPAHLTRRQPPPSPYPTSNPPSSSARCPRKLGSSLKSLRSLSRTGSRCANVDRIHRSGGIDHGVPSSLHAARSPRRRASPILSMWEVLHLTGAHRIRPNLQGSRCWLCRHGFHRLFREAYSYPNVSCTNFAHGLLTQYDSRNNILVCVSDDYRVSSYQAHFGLSQWRSIAVAIYLIHSGHSLPSSDSYSAGGDKRLLRNG